MVDVIVNGVKLYYELHGKENSQKYPLILIAGLSCDTTMWAGIIKELTEYFQVLIFDNRDVGQSQYVNHEYSIENLAQDTLALMKHLGIDKANILGHSMGGTVAQTIAYLYPEKVNKLIIANTLIKFNSKSTAAETALSMLLKLPISRKLIFKASIPWILSKNFLDDKERVKSFIEQALKNPFPQQSSGFARQLKAILKFNSQSWFSKIHVSTLVIAGEEDILCPNDSLLLAKGISKAQFVNYPAMGHVPMIEIPDEFNRTIISFLEGPWNSG